MNNSAAIEELKMKQWLLKDTSIANIKMDLMALGYDQNAIEQIIGAYKKERNARRQTTGFILLATGALTGFVSCLLGIFNPIPELFDVLFYGLTSVAVVIVVTGLYFLFE